MTTLLWVDEFDVMKDTTHWALMQPVTVSHPFFKSTMFYNIRYIGMKIIFNLKDP